ncbi:42496_t:CDS:2, partial [Gigaspora margarita]
MDVLKDITNQDKSIYSGISQEVHSLLSEFNNNITQQHSGSQQLLDNISIQSTNSINDDRSEEHAPDLPKRKRCVLDGWTAPMGASFYNYIITTSSRKEHLFQIKDYSIVSQTGNFLAEEINN